MVNRRRRRRLKVLALKCSTQPNVVYNCVHACMHATGVYSRRLSGMHNWQLSTLFQNERHSAHPNTSNSTSYCQPLLQLNHSVHQQLPHGVLHGTESASYPDSLHTQQSRYAHTGQDAQAVNHISCSCMLVISSCIVHKVQYPYHH